MNVPYSLLLIAITAVITFALRAVPFVLFGGERKMSPTVKKVADLLPPSIMAVLVIYCLKSDLFQISSSALASFIGVLSVVLLHLWKRNTLLSIAGGTILYMICLHVIPGI